MHWLLYVAILVGIYALPTAHAADQCQDKLSSETVTSLVISRGFWLMIVAILMMFLVATWRGIWAGRHMILGQRHVRSDRLERERNEARAERDGTLAELQAAREERDGAREELQTMQDDRQHILGVNQELRNLLVLSRNVVDQAGRELNLHFHRHHEDHTVYVAPRGVVYHLDPACFPLGRSMASDLLPCQRCQVDAGDPAHSGWQLPSLARRL